VINGRIIHPTILSALAAAGHRSTILVSDAHYAATTAVGVNAAVVRLNLEKGTPTIPHVVELLASYLPFEKRTTMGTPDPEFGEVQREIEAILGPDVAHESIERGDFYAAARSNDLALCIVTGDTRRFGNVLLTVGVNTGQ
jgi:L-fucose mutarotase